MKDIFLDIYKKNAWGGEESVSGPGSSIKATKMIVQALADLIGPLHIQSILDAPCGDFNWMKLLVGKIDRYIGVDIVPEIIEQNNRMYRNSNATFFNLDITVDCLPQVDLILCRDCLVHFSYQDIKRAITNFKKSSSKYLLTTSFTARTINTDITTGGWRPVNFQIEPFNFPVPLLTINENCIEGNGQYTDKSLLLWRLDDIKL